MKRKTIISYVLSTVLATTSICTTVIATVSCSTNNSDNQNITYNQEWKDMYYGWYSSLTSSDWNRDENDEIINYYCNSEQQAIALFANFRGWFYNQYLHLQYNNTIPWPPSPFLVNLSLSKTGPKEIRFDDYQLISNALSRAYAPVDMTVYHGVEYQEIEFWNQLKQYVVKGENEEDGWDYSGCVGKTFTSYGFIKTSLDKQEAIDHSNGAIFNDDKPWEQLENNFLPFYEPVCFVINIKARTQGVAYLADYLYANTVSETNQVLINRNCQFRINKIEVENETNIFYVDLL